MNAVFQNHRLRMALLVLVDLLLIAGLFGFLWFDNAVNRGVTFQPAPQPIPFTNGPQLGVNLYNIQFEPDQTVVPRSFELARRLGVGYARMQAPWEDIEIHARGDFSDRRNVEAIGVVDAWAKYDYIVREANAAEIELILRLERPPRWARAQFDADPLFQAGLAEDGNSTGPPDDFADFANFVRILVERYDGDGLADAPGAPTVRFFQIWNEPNLKNEWNWQTPRPEDFVELLRVASEAARSANPDAVILFPGLAPTDGLDSRAPLTELEYLDRVYRAGGAEYFDIMAAQSYGLGQSPDEHRYIFLRNRANWSWSRPIDTRNDVSRVVLLREVMERNGDSATPVWVTEFGWNAAPDTIPPERRFTWGEPVSEETKGAYLIGQVERARNEWPWMGVMNVWMLRYGGYAEPDPADPTPYFALATRDWQTLPSFDALQAYLRQPTVAGVGAFTWDHPAVEQLPDGWRLRFSGQRLTIVGGLSGDIGVTLNGEADALIRDGLDGRQTLSTRQLADGEHVLEIRGNPAPEWFIVSREQPAPWFWTLTPLLLVALLALSGAATLQSFTGPLDDLRRRWRDQATAKTRLIVALSLMTLSLVVYYRLSPQLPLTLLGLAGFAVLALWRPDLALLFVPLTVPLYFLPKAIFDTRFGLRENGISLPLHEVVLLITLAATALRWALAQLARRAAFRVTLRAPRHLLPIALFVAAGVWGVIIAESRGPALREFRWLIVEPLLFYSLVRFWAGHHNPDGSRSAGYRLLVPAFLLGGACVGLIGILQFAGLNLVPLIGRKVGFSDDSIFVEGVRRVSSVFGHPNNFGLFMGRIWPLAAVLALVAWRQTADRRLAVLYAIAALLSLAGLLVSFSRGAYLGALAAGAVIAAFLLPSGWWRNRRMQIALGMLGALGVLGAAAILLFDIERFNPFGNSSAIRLQTWASALAMLRDHPLGIGLDQFGRLYPQYIDPSLADTNEINTAHPHNLLLDIALRMGPLGIIAFAWIIAAQVRTQRTTSLQASPDPAFMRIAILAVLAGALVHGLVDSFYFWPDLAFAFWLFVALSDE